ncbi:SRPBCC family protein [Actinokineospora sp. NBRC 105648]|uniref:SRPBCC family protein n=1 Tax=Actinokineospora sp. NBRC 105648 TaxID=3032206 RepID=UPI0024A0E371|nr:SRPBCC family protein [Actinokineospora sp. NBRC 105648]GLZ43463.1 hypothetical protein Acsp05_70870 [Actinokineospora sp. NBRC 105648]
MGNYRHSAPAAVPAEAVFAYLADVRNLPHYFPRLTKAEPLGGSEVLVEAEVDGTHIQSKAWLLLDPDSHSLRWGADGPNDYHGSLVVHDSGAGECAIEVELVTNRAVVDSVQDGLKETVAMLTQAVAASDTNLAIR